MTWNSRTCCSTDPASPVDQVVQLGDDVLALAAGYRRGFGCCHCCALLSDWNQTATRNEGCLLRASCFWTVCCCCFFPSCSKQLTSWHHSHFLHCYGNFSAEPQVQKWVCWTDRDKMKTLIFWENAIIFTLYTDFTVAIVSATVQQIIR